MHSILSKYFLRRFSLLHFMVLFVQLLFYECICNDALLRSSMNGDYNSVKRLLNDFSIDTNIEDIYRHKKF